MFSENNEKGRVKSSFYFYKFLLGIIPYFYGFVNSKDEKDAHIEMLTLITEELNDYNRPLDDGTRPERYFDVSLVDEKFDAVVRCWDGDDYDYVTGYKIVPITI